MDTCTLRALNVTATSSPRTGFAERSLFYGQTLRVCNARKYPFARRVKFLEFRAPSSVKFRFGTIEAASKGIDSKEDDLAFVAGATGRVGSRAVRELLKLGFRVKAGVRSAKKAEGLVQSVKQMKLDGDKDGIQPVEKLELVECDLEKPSQILPALGNASVVLCCIGASEKEVFDITGPYRIDFQATKNLIDAATSAKVNHFVMVSSLGTNKIGFPAAILNLFWGVLIWKRQAEEALIASGIPYTIVRPGGMERPTDSYKLTHNITLSEEDTLFGGQVSNLQVAELMAVIAKNRSLSYCKVVEVIAETTAPLTPMEELLAKIPSQRAEPKLVVPDAADSSVSSPPTAAVSELPSTPIDKETDEPPATRPLSPYASYEDLKPPTSPSPAPPFTQKQVEVSPDAASEVNASSAESIPSTELTEAKPIEMQKPQPLSPFTTYDDLKPPTSPSPIPSGSKEVISGASIITKESVEEPEGGNGVVAAVQVVPNDEHGGGDTKSRPLSPYAMYEDLKPPTSPTPFHSSS